MERNAIQKPIQRFLPKKGVFPMKAIITIGPDPAPFMYDEGGPLSSSLGLNAIPKLMFNRFSHVTEVNKHIED